MFSVELVTMHPVRRRLFQFAVMVSLAAVMFLYSVINIPQQGSEAAWEGGIDAPIQPLMQEIDRELLKKQFRSASSLFEFGAGGSTVAAVGMDNMRNIHTVENNILWVASLSQRKDVTAAREAGRHLFSVVDVGPLEPSFSFPKRKDERIHDRLRLYSDQIFEDPTAQWDLVFIDGRFRAACALKAMQYIVDPDKTKVMIHDYPTRPAYHVIEQFADIVEKGAELYVFRKKGDVDAATLAAAAKRVELDLQ